MATKNYTTKTAALRATIADINKIDAKKIKVNGKDVVLGAKHTNDTRETVTENDIWGQWIETKSDGTIIVHDDEVVNPNGNSAWNTSITKIAGNKAYIGDEFYANIQQENMKNGRGLFSGCSNFDLSIENLTINTFPNLEDGTMMFKNCSNLTSWLCYSNKISTTSHMFEGCSKLTQLNIDITNVKNAVGMFSGCSEMVFGSNVVPNTNNLQSTSGMFQNCPKIFEHFDWKLPSVTNAGAMFQNCTSLKSFSSDLPNLTNGQQMFEGCTSLSSFSGCLSSLTHASNMFHKCKLDANSVLCIINTINDLASLSKKGYITISIDVSNDTNTIEQQLQTFAEETLFDSWDDLKQAFVDKAWTVTWQYGGSDTSITYGLRGGERIIPCPIYAQLIEVEDTDNAEYTNEDGSKFYNINWGHDVTHPQEFQQFDSLEDAMVAYGVILK